MLAEKFSTLRLTRLEWWSPQTKDGSAHFGMTVSPAAMREHADHVTRRPLSGAKRCSHRLLALLNAFMPTPNAVAYQRSRPERIVAFLHRPGGREHGRSFRDDGRSRKLLSLRAAAAIAATNIKGVSAPFSLMGAESAPPHSAFTHPYRASAASLWATASK